MGRALSRNFWDYVDRKPSRKPCWPWLASGTSKYGRWKQKPAHRVAYARLRGPVPDDKEIDHTCLNTRCMNPWHMEIVTPRENRLRSGNVGGLNARKTHCLHGHPLSGTNLRIATAPSQRGKRQCLICRRERWRLYRERKRV